MFETKYMFQAGIETYTVNTQKIAWPICGPQLVLARRQVFSAKLISGCPENVMNLQKCGCFILLPTVRHL
jgi:hypothetical protein